MKILTLTTGVAIGAQFGVYRELRVPLNHAPRDLRNTSEWERERRATPTPLAGAFSGVSDKTS